MFSNTPYLRTGLFLALLFSLSAGFYQVVSYQLGFHHEHRYYSQGNHYYPGQDDRRAGLATDGLKKKTVELPLFPGCNDDQDYDTRYRCARIKLGRYIDSNINQKIIDRKGRVYVGFTVNLAGQLQNARLVEKTDPVLAAEVMRLIGLQQGEDLRWVPGKIKGIPRAMNVTLQVSFGQRCKGCEQVMVEMVP